MPKKSCTHPSIKRRTAHHVLPIYANDASCTANLHVEKRSLDREPSNLLGLFVTHTTPLQFNRQRRRSLRPRWAGIGITSRGHICAENTILCRVILKPCGKKHQGGNSYQKSQKIYEGVFTSKPLFFPPEKYEWGGPGEINNGKPPFLVVLRFAELGERFFFSHCSIKLKWYTEKIPVYRMKWNFCKLWFNAFEV